MADDAPPADRQYLPTHEWHQIAGDTATIGITQTAADELTDVTYVSLPKVGEAVTAGERFGEIESVKATSDLIAGVTGTVSEPSTTTWPATPAWSTATRTPAGGCSR